MPHFSGCTPAGLWPPNSNSAEIFVQCTNPSFIILCLLVRKLSYWQTNLSNKHTHKQTPLKTFNALRYTMTFGKYGLMSAAASSVSVTFTTNRNNKLRDQLCNWVTFWHITWLHIYHQSHPQMKACDTNVTTIISYWQKVIVQPICQDTVLCPQYFSHPKKISNVIGRHWGPKLVTERCHDILILCAVTHIFAHGMSLVSVMHFIFFIVESGIMQFLCTMHVFNVPASCSSPRLPLCQILCVLGPPVLS